MVSGGFLIENRSNFYPPLIQSYNLKEMSFLK